MPAPVTSNLANTRDSKVQQTWTLVSSMHRTTLTIPFARHTLTKDLSWVDRWPLVKLRILCKQVGTPVTCDSSFGPRTWGTWPPMLHRRVSTGLRSLVENYTRTLKRKNLCFQAELTEPVTDFKSKKCIIKHTNFKYSLVKYSLVKYAFSVKLL